MTRCDCSNPFHDCNERDGCRVYRLLSRRTQPAQVPTDTIPVPVEALTRWRAAFAEELAAWDIDPPLHHVKTSHDEIDALLAAAPQPKEQSK